VTSYYEELRVAPSASGREIRCAYRQLVKLLHPDKQQQPDLRCFAEAQLKRLNSIMAILMDPELRQRYDEELRLRRKEPSPPLAQRAPQLQPCTPPPQSLVWGAATAIAILGFVWIFRGDEARSEAGRPAEPAAAKPVAAGAPEANPKASRRKTRKSLRLDDPPVSSGQMQLSTGAPLTSAVRVPWLPAEERSPVQTAADTKPNTPPKTRGISGAWVYSTQHPAIEKGMYAPAFVEIDIAEQDGRVQGRYRAAYRVGDSTVSPNVAFTFEGVAGSKELTWTGAHGAKGKLRLKLLTDKSMEAAWWTTEMGTVSELTSGTAVLLWVEVR
jgi:curved DNA-binding protein CbpA